jgi:hypothetical protein
MRVTDIRTGSETEALGPVLDETLGEAWVVGRRLIASAELRDVAVPQPERRRPERRKTRRTRMNRPERRETRYRRVRDSLTDSERIALGSGQWWTPSWAATALGMRGRCPV